MSRFKKLVKFLSDTYQMDERVVAEVALDLFRCGAFDWRKL